MHVETDPHVRAAEAFFEEPTMPPSVTAGGCLFVWGGSGGIEVLRFVCGGSCLNGFP